MRLLVSVRRAEEVAAALEGGADIIDAKEPAHGALGPVDAPTLVAIASKVPEGVPLSVALGDAESELVARAAVAALDLAPRSAATYVKLGFATVEQEATIAAVVAAAVGAARQLPAQPAVVAVAYADRGGWPGAAAVLRAAARAGASGFLVDTADKDGRTLLDWITPAELTQLAMEGRARGLLVALAGSLGPAEIHGIRAVPANIVGVRGAACEGGRGGSISEPRVRALRQLLALKAEGALAKIQGGAPMRCGITVCK